MPPVRVHLTGTVDPATKERLRNAVYWLENETVSSIMERGVNELIDKLEAERGAPFPTRDGHVKTGRPRKA